MFLDKDIAGGYDNYRGKNNVFYTECYMQTYIKNAPDYIRCAKQSIDFDSSNTISFLKVAENNLKNYELFLSELNRLRTLRDNKSHPMHNHIFHIAQDAIAKLFQHFPNFENYVSWLTALEYLLQNTLNHK